MVRLDPLMLIFSYSLVVEVIQITEKGGVESVIPKIKQFSTFKTLLLFTDLQQ